MTDQTKKIKEFKEATKALRTAQEDLRLARARYNKAASDLIDEDS